MSIEITARHMNISQDMQNYAREKADALLGDFSRLEHIHVILDHQKHLFVGEVVVQGPHHLRIEAEDSSDDILVSLDRAFDKARKQLRKDRDKMQSHRVVKED